jgi:biopolymer transport protein ExbB/TolQ
MNRTTKTLLIFGVILTVVPFLIGFLITTISMISSFHDLSQYGIADPHKLAGAIGSSLIATMIGVVFTPVGIAMLIGSWIVHISSKRTSKSIQRLP